MHKVWAVIRREFIERVRSKWFLISTVLGPLFMIGVAVLPSVLAMKSGRVAKIAIVNSGAGSLADRVKAQIGPSGRFDASVQTTDEAHLKAVTDSLTDAVRGELLDGYLTLTGATLESGHADYRARNVSSLRDMSILEGAVRQAVVIERLQRRGIDPAIVQEAQGRIDLRTQRISSRGPGGESGEATFFLGYGVGLVLYMIILLYGINVMRSVIEEKQTRIVEVLVSSLKPFELMMGKVIGVGAVGLFQFSIWSLTGYLMMHYRAQILGFFHVSADAIAAVHPPAISGMLLVIAIVYFLLGYLLYSSMFAVVGASCNTEAEAQQAQQPVMMFLVASLIISFSALSDPTGQLAVGASLVPFSAPIIMPVRVATSDVALSQIGLSLAIMVVSCLIVVWGAARVYRIGILMYGKRPSLKELWRWAQQS